MAGQVAVGVPVPAVPVGAVAAAFQVVEEALVVEEAVGVGN